jgi:hypothetical protein
MSVGLSENSFNSNDLEYIIMGDLNEEVAGEV